MSLWSILCRKAQKAAVGQGDKQPARRRDHAVEDGRAIQHSSLALWDFRISLSRRAGLGQGLVRGGVGRLLDEIGVEKHIQADGFHASIAALSVANRDP